MPLKAICPSCLRAISVPDKYAGQAKKCPGCGAHFIAPSQPPPILQESLEPYRFIEPQQPATPKAEVRAVVDHHHKAAGGAFRTAFGFGLGCLAVCAVTVIGCVTMGGLFFGSVLNDSIQSSASYMATDLEISLISVVDAQIVQDDSRTTISVTVKNNATRPIESLSFNAKWQSPGRTLPWAQETINHSPRGGIEPLEQRRLELRPGFMSDLNNVEERPGAQFVMEIISVTFAK